jgi:hypothetical protein
LEGNFHPLVVTLRRQSCRSLIAPAKHNFDFSKLQFVVYLVEQSSERWCTMKKGLSLILGLFLASCLQVEARIHGVHRATATADTEGTYSKNHTKQTHKNAKKPGASFLNSTHGHGTSHAK